MVNDPLAGALVLAGIGYYSKSCAGYTYLGSTIGVLTAYAMGAPGSEIAAGLWGFNPALTSLAVSVFFVQSPASFMLASGAASSTAVLFAGMKTAMGTAFGVPALTLPFCAVASGSHLLRDSVPGLSLAKEPHSPELNSDSLLKLSENLKAYSKGS